MKIDSKNFEAREVAAIYAAIEHLSQRLEKLENSVASLTISTATREHSSKNKFNLIPGDNHGICTFEPNNKPCDKCLMCSTLGF
ncbi:MAG TPA: hypothetical protein VNK26_00945 [Pyrinomonadaceae bacterium]|jgi:K+/H+ antiporter YhaU regulatory subunit KhtT|nr:hypothetical protein [Pyrinomonadaceae bacterium]